MAKTSKKPTKKVTTSHSAEKKSAEKKSTAKKASKKKEVKNEVEVKETKKRGRPKKENVTSQTQETPVREFVKPNKPAYSDEDLNYFKQIILEKRQETLANLESLRERMVDANTGMYVNENSPYSLHMAELGTDAMEKEKNYLFTQREAKYLGYLDAALKRIEDKTYGYCIDCGAVIPKGRLEAVPHSQHCITCKNKFGK